MFKKFSLLYLFILIISFSARAMNFDIEVGLSLSTKYKNCDKELENYKQLISKYANAIDNEKPAYLEAAEGQLKRLKRCEERNKKGKKKLNFDKVAGSINFTF